MTFELLPFQTRCSDQIVRRFNLLASDRRRPMEYAGWATPFYQALAGLTGSGKTPILADTVAQIRPFLGSEPIILWMSKSKAVVDQTYRNFEPGGKYESLLEGFTVSYLADINAERIRDVTQPFIALTTVGSFNQRERGEGTLRVHKIDEDLNEQALWTMLIERNGVDSDRRRPLVIVYDEAQNLTDQQTDLLLELEPDVVLVASATMKTPGRLGDVIERLKRAGWSDDDLEDSPENPQKGLVTAVRSMDAVEAGLVKRQVVLGGYATEMETALGDMLSDFKVTTRKALELDAGFVPKAIYVCRTNVSQDDGAADNYNQPFSTRKAPPILIWRYLVEQQGVDPEDIAVYCDLKLDRKNFPAPPGFRLFSGGENDFAAFTEGDFHHIIFNLSLQEGWDDPSCCFAYIDKSMGSAVQVEQVIGRVLRQPGARHYADPDLNTANFFIRIDSRQEFPRILEVVRKKIAAEMPEVRLDGYSDQRDRRRTRLQPKLHIQIPEIHIDADATLGPLQEVIESINDYTVPSINNFGPGELTRARQKVGDGSQAILETRAREHSNRVVARWLIRRSMQSLYPEAAKTVDWADPRFEAQIEVTSRAALDLREKAERLVDAYLENADLAFEAANPFTVSDVIVKPDDVEAFSNSVHAGYSDLKGFEPEFARAIDATGLTWTRNPPNGGYSIPLLEKGESRRFFPDFIVWKDDLIFAIDPKGEHLIQKDAGRKLLTIHDETGKARVIVRLVTEGKWDADTIKPKGKGGYSVWAIGATGKLRCTHHATPEEAVGRCLDV